MAPMGESETTKGNRWTEKLLLAAGTLLVTALTWGANSWMDKMSSDVTRMITTVEGIEAEMGGMKKEMVDLNQNFSAQLSSLDMRAQNGRNGLNLRLVKTETELAAVKEEAKTLWEEVKSLRRRRTRSTRED